jgi:hypothetical protein
MKNKIKYINKNRQQGKTTELVNYVKDGRKFYMYIEPCIYDDVVPKLEISECRYNELGYKNAFKENLRVLVVQTSKEKDFIMRNFGLTYQEVETVDTIKSARGFRSRELVFDNFDSYIEHLVYKELNSIGNITMFSAGNSDIFSNMFLQRFEEKEINDT